MIHEMIRIEYMVFRNANYKYIHGDLIIHTSTYTVWFLKYKYTQKPNTHAMSEITFFGGESIQLVKIIYRIISIVMNMLKKLKYCITYLKVIKI